MALEGANIMGQAQVYNQTQNAVNTYMKSVAQQQAKLAAEQKALQDDLAKVKVEGIRQGDMPEFLESYNKSKDIFAKLNATRNPSEKIRLKREFDESMLNTAAVGADSRELAKGEDAAARMFMNPNIRDRYKPEAVEQFQLSKSLSRKDPRYVRDLSTLEQQVDASSTMSELDKIKKSLLDAVKPSFVQRDGKLGDNAGTFVSSTRSVTPEEQIFATSLSFDVSPKLRAGLRQMYKQYEDLPDDQFKAIVIPDWVSKNPAIDYSEEKFVPGMTEYQRRSLALRESEAAGGGDGVGEPIAMDIPYADGRFFRAEEYVTIPTGKKNFAGSEYIDMADGKPVKGYLPSSADYEMVGVVNVPTIKQGATANKSLWGAVSQPDFAKNNPGNIVVRPMIHVQAPSLSNPNIKRNLLIPYDRLPETIKNTPSVKKALKKFTPASVQSKQSKKYSDSQEKGISAVMSANKISRQEAISALINAGRLSK
jgi:NACalpha-BTF3-like transcription factor